MTKNEIAKVKKLRESEPKEACTKCGASMYVKGYLCVNCHGEAQANVPATLEDWSKMAEAFHPKGNQ